MQLLYIILILALGRYAAARASLHVPSLQQMKTNMQNNLHKRGLRESPSFLSSVSLSRSDTPPLEIPTNQNNITRWTPTQNKRQMQITDDAFIARDLPRFNHHPNVTVCNMGGAVMNLAEHFNGMRLTYASEDLTLHNHDYQILFAEGDWTVAVAKVTAIQNGPLDGLDGSLLPLTNKPISMDLMTIAKWNKGWMMEESLWSDAPLMYRQIGILPTRSADNLPDLEVNQATPLSITHGRNYASLNKAAASKAGDASNKGIFTLESLKLSPGALVYGLSDLPMTSKEYIQWLKEMKRAFPDLHLNNKP